MGRELPEGVVTFLFTDVEGSTRMFEDAPDLMLEALRQHDDAIEAAVAAHDGVPVRPRGEGDSRFVVFDSARDAVAGAAEMQRRLYEIDWVTPEPLRVRASLHTGHADLRWGDYYGSAVNRGARLRELAHGGQIVMSGATYALVQDELPDGLTVEDLGAHGLKDLSRRERVYQVAPDGLPDAFPPLASPDSGLDNLPEQLTEFVGRQAELAEARRLTGETRLLTLLAPGGTGKTRLAVQLASEIGADYRDGVCFVGLADISSSDAIIEAIAESLGLALSGGEDVQSQLSSYLEPRQQLLLLDSLEHLDDAAAMVAEILKAAPGVTIVATSRSRLNLSGETVLSLVGLETSCETPEEARQSGGAQLFLQAARRADPGFSLEADDLEALTDILRLTGGMPLGIMLAAAWVDMLPLGEIAAEIGESADFLETEMADIPDRQRSVRAVFDSSWSHLTATERDVYARLSVFRGGFTRNSAKAVAGADIRALKTLSDKSLLQRDPASERFVMHVLLRQYAAEQLQVSGSAAEVHSDHMTHYTDLMAGADSRIRAPEQMEALDQVEAEFENVRAAWEWAVENHDADAIMRSLEALYWYCVMRARVPSGESLFETARERFGISFDAEAHPLQRRLILRFNNHGAALGDDIERMLDLARALGSQSEVAFFLWMLGVNRYSSREFNRAIAALEEALVLADESGSDFYRIELLHLLSLCRRFLGQVEDARALGEQIRDLSRRTGNMYALGRFLGSQGLYRVLEADDPQAKQDLLEAIEIRQEMGDHAGVAVSFVSLGIEAFYRGDFPSAYRFADEGRRRAVESNSPFPGSFALSVLGLLSVVEEAYGEARELSHESMALASDPNIEFASALVLALSACGLEDYHAAGEPISTVLESHGPFHTDRGLACSLPVIAMLHAHSGDAERAVEVFALALTHPKSPKAWMVQWPLLDRWQAKLESMLGSEAYSAAWHRGMGLDLRAVTSAPLPST